MATETDDVTVDFDAVDAEVARGKAADAPAAAATVETGEPEVVTPPKVILKPEEGVEKLKKQLDDERAGRLAAEKRADDASRGEAEARGRAQSTELDLVKGEITRLTQATDVLEADYANAMAAQDWGAAAKAQRSMATNAAMLQSLENGKAVMEKAPKPSPRAPTDPVDAYVSTIGAEYPKSRAWVRAHGEFARTEEGQEMLHSAHRLAVARKLKPESDEYFAHIEKTLELTPAAATPGADGGDDPMGDAASVAVTPARRNGNATPASAPVTRAGNGTGSRKGTITLTPAQVEAAHMSFPDSKTPLEDYAKQVLALKKEGQLS